MHKVMMLAVFLGGITLAIAAIGGTIVLAIRALKEGFSGKEQKLKAEEARMIQEIYRGMERMEERVEVLETLLLEREEKEL